MFPEAERITRVIKLDRDVFKGIRDDPRTMAPALTIMVFSLYIGGLRTISQFPNGALIVLLSPILCWFVPSSLLYVLGKYLGGKSNYAGYLKATGYAQIPMVLNIIPVQEIGLSAALIGWLIYMTVATRQTQEFSKRKAVLTVFIPVAFLAILFGSMIATEARAFILVL